MSAGFLTKLARVRVARMRAQRAQNRLDTALRQRRGPEEISRLQEEAESLWAKSGHADSALAQAKDPAARARNTEARP